MNELTTTFRIESPPAWLEIGYDAENNWRTITINCEYWFNIDANGIVVLMFKPSCKKPAYPLKVERSGNNIVWTPESAELVAGVGTMQAFFEVDGTTIGASKKIPCEVDPSLLGSASGGTPPWAIDMIEQIRELTGHYPYVADNILYVWDSINEEWIAFASGGGGGVTVDDTLSDTSTNPVQNRVITNALSQKGTYSKPNDGIPESDLASAVQTILDKANSAYQKPSSGIPSSDLAQAIQTILNNAVLFSSQTRTNAEKEQARANIGAASMSDLGTVFTLKGGVATVNDLPQTGNRIGDVWYVENVSAGFIWITSTAYPNGYWEELGETVDLSAYAEKTWVQSQGYQTAQDVQDAIIDSRFDDLDYIEADGQSYFDTGILPSADLEVEVSFRHKTAESVLLASRQFVFGSYAKNGSTVIDRCQFMNGGNAPLSQGSTNSGLCGWNGAWQNIEQAPLPVSDFATVTANATAFKKGTTTFYTPTAGTFDANSLSVYLFGCHVPSGDTLYLANGVQIESAIFRKNGVVIASFEPKQDKVTGAKGFVNTVDGTFTPLTSTASGDVTSVNGKTGTVVLNADDVNALARPSGGTTGQVLTKTANGEAWQDAPTELPAVTASNNGDFLRVVNGAWAAATVPAAESNSFGGGS